ncbi:MAG: metal ABC transporter permease [Oscillospiraceae bacterium]|jgi:zinc transport system permease protein|nr:metal ABC transporter permease [Oscillospiraceae bacterium]
MFGIIVELFSFPFVVKALIVGGLVSLCAALLGVSLVLKRYSMIGDGLSHVGFGTLGLAAALGIASPLKISVPLVLLAAFGLLRLSESGKIKGDAAIALVSSGSLAIGSIIVESKGLNADLTGYMFGTILAVGGEDLYISSGIAIAVAAAYIFFYNRIFAVTFDEDFSKATGVNVKLYNTVLAALTALVVVVGMRVMGALLISGLIIFPALTAMRVFKNFKSVVVCSAVVSIVCFFSGIILSYVRERATGLRTPAGASVVVANLAVFLAFTAAGIARRKLKGRKRR